MPKPVIGLIGGIGSGKSLVAGFFAELGAQVIDADRFGHEALKQPEIRALVVARWGPGVLNQNGEVDRRKVAAIVFNDPKERQALEALVFPWIERRIREELARAEADPNIPFTVLDAAILLETGWGKNCDKIVLVEAPRETRLKRLASRSGWSEQEVEAREQAQLTLEEKAARADYRVDNSGEPAQARDQVRQLASHITAALAADRRNSNPGTP